MKKPALAAVALCCAGIASAQSSVTLFGIVDATLAHGSGSISSKTQMTNSGYNSSRLGFRGVEDLGGGLSASFWLEAGLNNDNGTGAGSNTNNQTTGAALATGGGQGLVFNRRSTVSVAGRFGELRLGRDHTPHIWTIILMDAFTLNGVGLTQTFSHAATIGGTAFVRASNSISYLTPSCSGPLGCTGFWAHAMYFLGENASNAGATSNDGDGYSVRGGYGGGNWYLAAATSRTKYATGDIRSSNLGAEYKLGAATLIGQVSNDRVSSAVPVEGRGGSLGVRYTVGVGEIRAAYSRYRIENGATSPASAKLAIGYVHNLSKRTAVYATYARVNNKGGAAQALNGSVTGANQSSTGYDVGLRQAF